jgi:hypothetical protein
MIDDPLPLSFDDHGDTVSVRLERRYEHSRERVWRAITDPAELAHWFPANEPLQVIESQPPSLLSGTWFGDVLRFELRSDGEACVLLFSHTFGGREKAARDASGWDRCFARFDALLAGAPISAAESLRDWPETHERYAERFELDPALGRRTFAEYLARQ